MRPAAVAGAFYPGRADRLRDEVETMLGEAPVVELRVAPRILIVPHAGYVYSGPVAASLPSWDTDRRLPGPRNGGFGHIWSPPDTTGTSGEGASGRPGG